MAGKSKKRTLGRGLPVHNNDHDNEENAGTSHISETTPLLLSVPSPTSPDSQDKSPISPNTASRRITLRHWAILFFACMLLFGNYYCYDIPAALNVPLQKWMGSDYAAWQWQINVLYSVYSIPNIFLPLIGGLFIDRLGPTIMLFLFSFCVCAGQALFSLGVASKTFSLMVIGRTIFGLGGESLEVAQARLTTDWFQGRALAFALGLNLSFARIATASNDNLSPWIQSVFGTTAASWFGVIICVLSFLNAIGMIILNRPGSRIKAGLKPMEGGAKVKTKPARKSPVPTDDATQQPTSILSPSPSSPRRRRQLLKLRNGSEEILVVEENMDAKDEFVGKSSSSSPTRSVREQQVTIEDSYAEEEEDYDEQDENIHCSEIFNFSKSFWLLCFCTIAMYGSASPFFHICTDFFMDKWYEGDLQTAGMVMSMPDIMAAILSPIFGIIIDRIGRRGTLLPFAGVLLFITHSLLTFTDITPFFAMAIMGVAYAMFAAVLWPCVPYLVKSDQIATGFGILAISLNISLATFPLMVAQIRSSAVRDGVTDKIAQWKPVGHFFVLLTIIGTLSAVALRILDSKSGNILEKIYSGPNAVCLNNGDENEDEEIDFVDDEEGIASRQESVAIDGIPITDTTPLITTSPVLSTSKSVSPRRGRWGDMFSNPFLSTSPNENNDSRKRSRSRKSQQRPASASTTITRSRSRSRASRRSQFREEEGDVTVKVVSDGIHIVAPSTYVHHHHGQHGVNSNRLRSPSARSPPVSPSKRGNSSDKQ